MSQPGFDTQDWPLLHLCPGVEVMRSLQVWKQAIMQVPTLGLDLLVRHVHLLGALYARKSASSTNGTGLCV